MRGRYRSLVSLVFFSGTSVYSLDSTCDPRSLLTPSIRILLRLAYCLAKVPALNSTDMCVIDICTPVIGVLLSLFLMSVRLDIN